MAANPPGGKERPKCVAIVICNEIIEDKRTNNKTLVSLFNGIMAPELPFHHARMFIMASLTNGLGEWPLRVRISAPSTEVVAEISGQITFSDPLVVQDLVFELHNLMFQEAGIHCVDVYVGTEVLAERRFDIRVSDKGHN